MINEVELAIVIPAYKSEFLYSALESIANQSCKKFNLYIGDDASPHDLYDTVKKFQDHISIFYKRFDNNIGGYDLVKQWDRCIDMVSDEKWIWLFSDDDVMGSNCVELFISSKNNNPNIELFHFDVNIIDQAGVTTTECLPFNPVMSAGELFANKIKLRLTSTIVEYIFKRSLFESAGGFERFDLAWGSDDATWIKLTKQNSIFTIQDAKVYWRLSNSNISSSVKDMSIVKRKIAANLQYLSWAKHFFAKQNIVDQTNQFEKLKWILQTVKHSSGTLRKQIEICFDIVSKTGWRYEVYILGALYLIYSSWKNSIKKMLPNWD